MNQMTKLLYEYINGNHRVQLFSDGTKIKETIEPDADHFTYAFPENADIKITDFCDNGCAYCHENSTINGKHGDLRSLEPLFRTMHQGQELAIGGGNALAHPDLVWMLELLHDIGVVSNITVNQNHVVQYRDLLEKLVSDGLVHGIGVSLMNSADAESFKVIDSLGDNVVIHTIAGILSQKDVKALVGRKVLILGYKDLRRGHSYLDKQGDDIRKNMEWLKGAMPRLSKLFKCMSFDCLGIEQLDPQHVLGIPDDEYYALFQGSDTDVTDSDGNITCATMYIDCVTMTCARMSTAALDKRFAFSGNETIEDLFAKSIQGW